MLEQTHFRRRYGAQIFLVLIFSCALPAFGVLKVTHKGHTRVSHHRQVFTPTEIMPMIASSASELSTKSDFSSNVFSEDAHHLIVGHSATLHSQQRLSKVYVTDPTVLYAYTASPNDLLVTAKQSGISSVVVWDENGEIRSYLFSADVDSEVLRTALKEAMPREDIHVSANEDHIVLSGVVSTKSKGEEAEKLAGLYSKSVSNALTVNSASIQQVRLKVRIIEVDRSRLEQIGVNLFSTGGNTLAQSSTMQFPSTLAASTNGANSSTSSTTVTAGNKTVAISNPLNFLLYSSQLNIGAMLQDLETKQVLQILAEPNITAISGQKANFLAGGEFPFPVVQGSTGGLTSISIQFRPYGVRLDFTPIVNADGTIQLTVAPEVSALDYTNAVQISGYTVPALSTRRAETQVVLHDGQTFAISGLLDNRMTDQLSRTPGIASIPILGALFKSKSLNHSRTELLVLVTPEVVDLLHQEETPSAPKMAVPGIDQERFDRTLPHPDVPEERQSSDSAERGQP